MEYNYSVREGELLQINSRKARMVIRFAVLFRFLKMLLLLFSFGVTVYVTYLIFSSQYAADFEQWWMYPRPLIAEW